MHSIDCVYGLYLNMPSLSTEEANFLETNFIYYFTQLLCLDLLHFIFCLFNVFGVKISFLKICYNARSFRSNSDVKFVQADRFIPYTIYDMFHFCG